MKGSAELRRTELWTIGHSNHSLESFLGLLNRFNIDVVADVRSHPYTRYASHFSQAPLRRLLADEDLRYVFMGRELGGRPDEPQLYDSDGRVLYEHLASVPRFRDGLSRLLEGTLQWRVALMCSEENPTDCHRRLLITRAIQSDDPTAAVHHIRGDGREIEESQFVHEVEPFYQPSLFGERPQWKSAQSVSPNTALRTSLRY